MSSIQYQADVGIIGAGLTGITAALELLDSGKRVTIVDCSSEDKLGGLANNAFGGMLLNGTREQKLLGVKDSPERMHADWLRAAEFKDQHVWQKRWAEAYAHRSTEEVYHWLRERGIRFFPIVHWVERGDFRPGNSVPRYHIAWGCGNGIVQALIGRLKTHPNASKLTLHFGHRVERVERSGERVTGCTGKTGEQSFTLACDHLIVASGGINGDLARVRKEWDPVYGPAPTNMLNGSDPMTDGEVHDAVSEIGGRVSNLGWMWNYAAGIAKPKPEFEHQGLALIPPRSALWMDCYGRRVGPDPMIGAFDTHRLCKRMGHLPHQYSWLILNRTIALREMAVSGSDMNPSFRDKRVFKIILGLITGAKGLVEFMVNECPDVVIGNSYQQLAERMNALAPEAQIDAAGMQRDIEDYDTLLRQGKRYFADDQLRRIAQARKWIGDWVRTCRYQPINDKKAMPLIAIRMRFLSRKSMGGIETDLHSRVLAESGSPIPGLFAAGEAAGFGGGGIAGVRSLEGTFLSNCVFNARAAAKAIQE